MNLFIRFSWILFIAIIIGCQERIVQPDFTSPSAPRGLSTQTGDKLIELFWIENPEPDLAGYNIYASTTYNGRYELIGSTSRAYFADEGIQNGKTYYYAVAAYDFNRNESPLSRDVAYDTPRPEGFNVAISDYRSSPDRGGYDFSSYSIGPYDDQYTDFFFENYNNTYYVNVWEDSDIQDLGYTSSLYDVGTVPQSGWSPTKDARVILGHTYAVRTWDNHYAKVRLTSVSSSTLKFDWAYQLQPNNPRLKQAAPVSRTPLQSGMGVASRR